MPLLLTMHLKVSKGDCIIMFFFNHGHIKWDTLQSTGLEDQALLCLVQDNFLTQHVLEPTRSARVLDNIVLSLQKEFVDNVVIQEPLGSSDHNQLHFNNKIKSDKSKAKQCRRDFRKGNYKEIRKSLAHIDCNDKMKNKTATECWNILRRELDSAIDRCVPAKKVGRVLDRVLSSHKEFVDNVVIQEPLGSSDHNQLHFNIKIKSEKTKVKQCRREFRKGDYKKIRKNLAHIDVKDKMKNKTAT